MKKNSIFILVLLFLSFKASAECSSVQDILNYAKQGQIEALKKCKNLDIEDQNNQTALCHAISRRDVKAYNSLKKIGANLNPPCVEKMPAQQVEQFQKVCNQYINKSGMESVTNNGTFWGLGTFGWTMLGILDVAAIAAISAGGIGGGGGSKDDFSADYIDMLNELNTEEYEYTTSLPTPSNDNDSDQNSDTGGSHTTNNLPPSNVYTHIKYASTNNTTQDIQDNSNKAIIGMYANSSLSNAYNKRAVLKIEKGSNATNSIYGIVSTSGTVQNTLADSGNSYSESYADGLISITSNSHNSGNIYGIYGTTVSNISANNTLTKTLATIQIKNISDAHIFGIYSRDTAHSIYATISSRINNAPRIESNIQIQNYGNGNSYGIYSKNQIYNLYSNLYAGYLRSSIRMYNLGQGNAVGLYSKNNVTTGGQDSNTYNRIEAYNTGSGTVIGISANSVTQNNVDEIYISNLSDGMAIGISGHTITNNGTITIRRTSFSVDGGGTYISLSGKSGTSVGIYADQASYVSNSGTIDISGATKAFGIYAKGNGGTIKNSGTIKISASTAYGIYIENGTGTQVINTGTITLNGSSYSNTCWGCSSNGNFIVLTGATLLNKGIMSAPNLDTDLLDGILTAGKDAQFEIQNNFTGTLNLSPELVLDGFETTYINENMIHANNTSTLNLVSKSALFDAKLADNGTDVIMEMKSFNSITKNNSLAHFLTNNYISGNNEKFFNNLKMFENITNLSNSLDKAIGKTFFHRINFEEMTTIRELTFNINNNLFHNKEPYFSMASNISETTGSNTHYSLTNKNNGIFSIGLGIAFSHIQSNNNNLNDHHNDTMYQMVIPMAYKTHGFNLITSPRIGYTFGTYKRTGFNEESYSGTIKNHILGLMNEVRYPLILNKWQLEPTTEFNILGYRQNIRENAKEFSLKITPKNTYSVETGIGLYLTKETEISKNEHLKLSAGLIGYHNFTNPYKLEIGMNGMNGSFTIRDTNYSNNRAVGRLNFNYEKDNLTLYTYFNSYINRKIHSSAKTGFKWNF